jgi:hypothetical protein
MSSIDDFAPIQDAGEIERSRGIAGRWRRRSNLPAVGHGSQRVFVDHNGAITGGRNLSAGEKYWAKGASWVTLDMGSHELSYDLAITDRSGRARYVVRVIVRARIADGQEHAVVRDRATTVKASLTSALREALASAMSKPARGPSGAALGVLGRETAEELEALRRNVDDALREQLVGTRIDRLPLWLDATVMSIDVHFDDTTRSHVQRLVEQTRTGALKELEVTQRQALRAMWRKELAPNLPGADVRMLEAVLDDPTPDAVRRTIEHMQGTERQHRQEMFEVLGRLIDGNHIRDMRDTEVWRALHAISRAIDPRNARLADLDLAALEGDDGLQDAQPAAIEVSADTAEHAPASDEITSDRDWS